MLAELAEQGVPRLAYWGGGVDGDRFAPARRSGESSQRLRREWAPAGELVVGYAGGPGAALGELDQIPGIALVVPGADSADAYAALDVFVDTPAPPGQQDAAQRALASGVPVIAAVGNAAATLVRPGLNGMHYRPDVQGELRRCVQAMAGDAHLRHWTGLAARAGFERRAAQLLGDELVARYREVIALYRTAS
jgi:phosphatidylinositol alpha 1,6-mannosyltransferase